MTLAPKEPKDLALAPVAAAIDMNLERLRDKPPEEIEYQLILELNEPAMAHSESERIERVMRVALHEVDMHQWTAAITDDRARLRLSGGSVSIDLGLSASLLRYIAEGVEKAVPPATVAAG
jgi:hypothetical protein